MQINKTSNFTPNFQAKIIITDDRVQKFARKSFMHAGKETRIATEKIDNYGDSANLLLSIQRIGDKQYLCAKNSQNSKYQYQEIMNSDFVAKDDFNAYTKLLKKITNTKLKQIKAFWT